MKGALLLDVVVTQCTSVLELFPGEDETLLVWGNAFLVLDLGLHVLDGVAGLDFEGDGLSGERLHEDLHTATQTEHQVKGALLLDVVVAQCTSVLELFPGEYETLLVWGDAFLVLDLSLHILDGVAGLYFEGDGLSGERLDEDLHTATQTEHQVKRRFLLNVIVAECAAILELFPGEDETLLVWGNAFLVLDLGLHVLDGVAGLDFEGDGLSGERLHEDLHTATQTEHQVKGALLLDVVVAQCAAVLELFPGEYETLLVWGDAFLVLDLSLHILDGVAGLYFEGDGLSGERLDEDLHTATETEYEVKRRFFLNVVVAECAAVLELFPGEDETLLVWGDAFLVLDLGLHVLDGVAGLDFEGDGLSGERLDEDLHTATETEYEVKRRFFLNVVVAECAAVLELFPGEDETLLVWGDAFLVLDLGLHVLDGVAGLDLEGDCFSGERLHEDLHAENFLEIGFG